MVSNKEKQKAIRISKAIQHFLEKNGMDAVRSTDVYPYLSRQGLVERDNDNGRIFRKFLHKLRENNLLELIPQCKAKPGKFTHINWWFYKQKNLKKIEKKTYSFDEKRKKNKYAYEKWTKEEDHLLKLHYKRKDSLNDLCDFFGRSRGAILSRLNKIS